MNRKSFSEVMTIRLQVESPVHIGSRHGLLSALEFIHCEDRVFVLDEEKLGRFLLERNLLDRFSRAAYSGELGKGGIFNFLRPHLGKITAERVQDLAAYSVPGGDVRMSQFRPFIRDGRGQIFLPGSSIKGALRTAVLYRSLKNTGVDEWLRKVRSWIEELEGETSRKRRFLKSTRLSEPMQKKLLQNYILENLKGQQGNHQNRDLLRCLKVRDAYPVEGKELDVRVIPVRFLARKRNGDFYWSQKPRGSGDLVVWVEAVVRGTFETEFIWDQELFERFRRENSGRQFPVRGLEDVLKCVVEMNGDVIEHERKFFENPYGSGRKWAVELKNWYDSGLNGSCFRVGYGTGMLSTTVNLLWPESLRQKVRNVCGHDRDDEPAPKTRRVWQRDDGPVVPLGWVRLFYRKGKEDAWQPVAIDIAPVKSQVSVADGARSADKSKPAGTASADRGISMAMVSSSPAKPVEKGQEREGTLHMRENGWFARFEGDDRYAEIENPQLIPSDTEEGTKAIFYIVYQSKKKGIKVRILKLLD